MNGSNFLQIERIRPVVQPSARPVARRSANRSAPTSRRKPPTATRSACTNRISRTLCRREVRQRTPDLMAEERDAVQRRKPARSEHQCDQARGRSYRRKPGQAGHDAERYRRECRDRKRDLIGGKCTFAKLLAALRSPASDSGTISNIKIAYTVSAACQWKLSFIIATPNGAKRRPSQTGGGALHRAQCGAFPAAAICEGRQHQVERAAGKTKTDHDSAPRSSDDGVAA